MYNEILNWRKNGVPSDGTFKYDGMSQPKMDSTFSSLDIYGMKIIGIETIFKPFADSTSFGYDWENTAFRKGTFPEYYKQEGDAFVPIEESKVPKNLGLIEAEFSVQEAIEDPGVISKILQHLEAREAGGRIGPRMGQCSARHKMQMQVIRVMMMLRCAEQERRHYAQPWQATPPRAPGAPDRLHPRSRLPACRRGRALGARRANRRGPRHREALRR